MATTSKATTATATGRKSGSTASGSTASRFARTLREHRERANLSQAELGVALDVDPGTIARIERGDAEPSRKVRAKLVRRFPSLASTVSA